MWGSENKGDKDRRSKKPRAGAPSGSSKAAADKRRRAANNARGGTPRGGGGSQNYPQQGTGQQRQVQGHPSGRPQRDPNNFVAPSPAPPAGRDVPRAGVPYNPNSGAMPRVGGSMSARRRVENPENNNNSRSDGYEADYETAAYSAPAATAGPAAYAPPASPTQAIPETRRPRPRTDTQDLSAPNYRNLEVVSDPIFDLPAPPPDQRPSPTDTRPGAQTTVARPSRNPRRPNTRPQSRKVANPRGGRAPGEPPARRNAGSAKTNGNEAEEIPSINDISGLEGLGKSSTRDSGPMSRTDQQSASPAPQNGQWDDDRTQPRVPRPTTTVDLKGYRQSRNDMPQNGSQTGAQLRTSGPSPAQRRPAGQPPQSRPPARSGPAPQSRPPVTSAFSNDLQAFAPPGAGQRSAPGAPPPGRPLTGGPVAGGPVTGGIAAGAPPLGGAAKFDGPLNQLATQAAGGPPNDAKSAARDAAIRRHAQRSNGAKAKPQTDKDPNFVLLGAAALVVIIVGVGFGFAWNQFTKNSETEVAAPENSGNPAATTTAPNTPNSAAAPAGPVGTFDTPTIVFAEGENGPIIEGVEYLPTIGGVAEGSLLQVVVSDQKNGEPQAQLPPLIFPAGQFQLRVDVVDAAGVVTASSQNIELWVLPETSPPVGYGANLSSVNIETQGWPEVIAKTTAFREAGHENLQLTTNERYPTLPVGYYVLFSGGFESEQEALNYCAKFNLSVPDECFARKFD